MIWFVVNALILIANILLLSIIIKLYTEILKNMLAGKRREGDEKRVQELRREDRP